jgi:hypothetical protein
MFGYVPWLLHEKADPVEDSSCRGRVVGASEIQISLVLP